MTTVSNSSRTKITPLSLFINAVNAEFSSTFKVVADESAKVMEKAKEHSSKALVRARASMHKNNESMMKELHLLGNSFKKMTADTSEKLTSADLLGQCNGGNQVWESLNCDQHAKGFEDVFSLKLKEAEKTAIAYSMYAQSLLQTQSPRRSSSSLTPPIAFTPSMFDDIDDENIEEGPTRPSPSRMKLEICKRTSILRQIALRRIPTDPSQDGASNTVAGVEIEKLKEQIKAGYEKRQKRLEEQLREAGVVVAEDIPYEEAKDQVERITRRLEKIGSPDVTHNDPAIQKALRKEYYQLTNELDKYFNALMLTDEYKEEQRAKKEAWETAVAPENQRALEKLQRHMPVQIRNMNRQEQMDAGVPAALVRKFERTSILRFIRRDPSIVAKWHPSILTSSSTAGLTLTELRALHCYFLKVKKHWDQGKSEKFKRDPMTQKKLDWLNNLTNQFKQALSRYEHHLEQTDGKACDGHRCSLIGRQCPVRADRAVYYGGDFGFAVGEVYDDEEERIRAVTKPGEEQESGVVSSKSPRKEGGLVSSIQRICSISSSALSHGPTSRLDKVLRKMKKPWSNDGRIRPDTIEKSESCEIDPCPSISDSTLRKSITKFRKSQTIS